MFGKLTDDLLDLTVAERGQTGMGSALPGIPLCCCVVLCISFCSSSSRPEELE